MKKIVLLVTIVSLLVTGMPAIAASPTFNDIGTHWAKDAILQATAQGIFSGNPDGSFAPERLINRAELAVVLTRALKLEVQPEANLSFKDSWQIPSWARGAVAAVVKADLMEGRSDGTFGPLSPVTREQAATVFVKALNLTNEALAYPGEPGFQDDNRISGWAKGFVAVAREIGLFKGDTQGRFLPQQALKRAEAAQVVVTYLRLAKEGPVLGWTGETGGSWTATTTANLNLRTGPNTSSQRLIVIPIGTTLNVGERITANGETWLRVTYQGMDGYIAGQFARLVPVPKPEQPEKPPEEKPAPEPPQAEKPQEPSQPEQPQNPPPTPEPVDPIFRVVDNGSTQGFRLVVPGAKTTVATLNSTLNVRSAPTTNGERLGSLSAGTRVTVQQVLNVGTEQWLEITYQGRRAYIAGWHATVKEDFQDSPAPGVNEFVLTQANDSLYTLTVKGTEPVGGRLRTEAGRVTLQVNNMDLEAISRNLQGPFTRLGISGGSVYLEHQLQQVEATLRATGDGSLQVLLGINPDDPNLGKPIGSQPPSGALAGRTIVLDAGHGGPDPGAIGTTYGTYEKDVNLDITLKTAALLQSQGANVILTRSSDREVTLGERVWLTNDRRPDIFVSIHADANNNPAIGGSTVYYSSSNPRATESYWLGVTLMDSLERTLGLRRVGVRDSQFFVLRNAVVPAVLVETAFLTNSREEGLLRQESFRQQAAQAIATGIVNYLTN